MSEGAAPGGVQGVYDFWLGLLPQFLGRIGAAVPGASNAASASLAGLPFPTDQVAKAAMMTQEALQSLGRTLAPMLQQSGAQGLLGQWAALMPQFPGAGPAAGASGAGAMPDFFAPWNAAMALFPGAPSKGEGGDAKSGASPAAVPGMGWPWPMALPFTPLPGAGTGDAAAVAMGGLPSLQAMQQAWLDAAGKMAGASPQAFASGFERTFGGLSDALGFGPMRRLQSAWQELLVAAVAQNDARARYMLIVQSAFTGGVERLTKRLAEMASSGERVESVLALLRLWAVSTEGAVHEVLQSERGLAATAALSRAGVAHRRKLQQVAAIIADALDMSTRRDLDEAFREIQALKRELRALRPAPQPAAPARQPPRAAKRKPR